MFKQISPNEKQNLIELVMVHTSGSPQELEQVRRVLGTKSEDELQRMAQQIRLRVQTEATRTEYVKLQIVRSGLKHSDQNWKIIDQRLPGGQLTLENFRNLVESDSAFKASLTWAREPFAEAIQEEQKQSSRFQAERRLFDVCANAVTGQGTNVAANDANFLMVKNVLEEDGLDFTQNNVINLLMRGGLQLAPNDKESSQELDGKSRELLASNIEPRIANSEHRFIIRNFIRTASTYAHLRDRVQLCEEIADNHSPDTAVNNREFCVLLLSKKENETLRSQVVTLRENKKFAAMSPLELKAYLAKKRAEVSSEQQALDRILAPAEQTLLDAVEKDTLHPPLPKTNARGETVDAAYLNRLQGTDYTSYRELLQKHGRLRLEARIRGVA
jgi:hypothetical protein